MIQILLYALNCRISAFYGVDKQYSCRFKEGGHIREFVSSNIHVFQEVEQKLIQSIYPSGKDEFLSSQTPP